MADLAALYPQHVAALRQTYGSLLDQEPPGTLLILHSGSLTYRFADDQPYPFQATPHFRAWLPLNLPECFLVLGAGDLPRLYYWQPEDFWYEPPQAPAGFWTEFFDLRVVSQKHQIFSEIQPAQAIYLGSNPTLAQSKGFRAVNPDSWVHALNYARSVKSAYEIACVRAANGVGVRGHQAAQQAFVAGASEYEIYLAFLAATGQQEHQCPYPPIVGLGLHASILHYEGKQPTRNGERSFLLDAGATCHGYASDITRTHVLEDGTAGSQHFAALIQQLDELQQRLIAAVRPGVAFLDLHEQAHRGVAEILQATGLVNLPPDQIFDQGITATFLPHGLGHLLGIQVHDVAGHYRDATGALNPPPPRYPFLRLTHTLRPGQVLTMEPGLYFIPALLAQLAATPQAAAVDWGLIDQLRPYGGIRIEDNVAVTPEGCENLTRPWFEAGETAPDPAATDPVAKG